MVASTGVECFGSWLGESCHNLLASFVVCTGAVAGIKSAGKSFEMLIATSCSLTLLEGGEPSWPGYCEALELDGLHKLAIVTARAVHST